MAADLSRAVVERRAPSKVSADDMAEALFRDLDYFPTPPWAARAVAHRLRQFDPNPNLYIGEFACGEGHFAAPLQEVFDADHVIASDIYDYGFGAVRDFLHDDVPEVDYVVTNHPFHLTVEFLQRALAVARRGVILAPSRLAFLEGQARQPLLYEGSNRLTVMMPFVERVPMQLASWDPDLSTATAYAGFAFLKGREPEAPLPFKTGTQKTYWRDDDVKRFAHAPPKPLFENLAPPPMLARVGAGCKRIIDPKTE